ncbi:reverse transcriptase domain-containing protein [Clostridium luticellarii]
MVPIIMQTIKLYIGKVGVMEDGEYKESKIGSPQGSPISPLLSNIYLNYFDVVWDKYYKHLGMLVKFADDFIIISRTKKEIYHAYNAVKKIFERLELQLHPDKTRFVNMWDGKEGFDFLGFHHRRSLVENGKGQRYHTTIQVPNQKAMKNMRRKIKEVLGNRSNLKMDMYDLVQIMNKKIVGLKNYYNLKYSGKQLNKIDWYIIERLTIWYNNKKQCRPRHRGVKEVMNKLNEIGLRKLSS